MKSITNPERVEMVARALRSDDLDAVVCALPVHVLMLSGYWPVVGTSIAVATRDGVLALLVPEDEGELTRNSWADEIEYFRPASLSEIRDPIEAAGNALAGMLKRLGVHGARIGYELGPESEPASYAAMNVYGGSIVNVLRIATPSAPLAPADRALSELTAIKTPLELDRMRKSCAIAAVAFEHASRDLWVGMRETEATAIFYAAFQAAVAHHPQVMRADAHFFCMSGPNAAKASAAFARTRRSRIEAGETVMIHCNSHADGYWTDITRTYVIGEPGAELRRWYEAVFEARAVAMAEIAPGALCAEVDAAARGVMKARGLGEAFRHSTGHGVGFAAISANARPRLHPKSPDVLQRGMTFNVEPAVYFDGSGGVRHCDMIAVGERKAEVLTAFQERVDSLWLGGSNELLKAG